MSIGIEEIDLRTTRWWMSLNLYFERVVVRKILVEAGGVKLFDRTTETVDA